MFKTGRMIGYGNAMGRSLVRGISLSNNHLENYYDDVNAPSLLTMYHSLTTLEKCLVIFLIFVYVITPIIYYLTI